MLKCFAEKKDKIIVTTVLFVSAVVLCSLSFLSGCGAKSSENKSVSVAKISSTIEGKVDLSQMKKGDKEKLKKLYKLNIEDIEEFSLYIAPSNIKADEIAIIKVKDTSKVDEIKEHIGKRVEKQANSFKEYLPEEYAIIEKHSLKSKGNYIFLAISKDVGKIEKVFDEAFK